MTTEEYQRLFAEARQADANFERNYGNEIFIPRKLNERQVERIKQLSERIRQLELELCNSTVEIDSAKEALRRNGITI